MALGISDEVLSTYVPVVVYWVFSGIYRLLGYIDGSRLHPKNAENEENVASKIQVLRGVLLQQVVQIAVVSLMMKVRIYTHIYVHIHLDFDNMQLLYIYIYLNVNM